MYPEQPQIVIADEEHSDPQGGKSLQNENGSGFLVLAFDELDGIEDEGLGSGDRRSETQNFTAHSHRGPDGVSLLDANIELVAKVRMRIIGLLISRGKIFRQILEKSAQLHHLRFTFSRPGV